MASRVFHYSCMILAPIKLLDSQPHVCKPGMVFLRIDSDRAYPEAWPENRDIQLDSVYVIINVATPLPVSP